MKFKVSKKLIVSSLASVMAVSLVGAVTGTVAWYQYNTRVTASLIGMNVAETGILEISKDGTNFTRDLTSADLVFAGSRTDTKLHPMTWATGANQTATSALSGTAYKNPDVVNKAVASNGSDYATRGSYATAWDVATAKNDYIQFDLYIRAREVDNVSGGFTQTAEDVYITDFVLADVGSGKIAEGLRIHMAVDPNGVASSGDEVNYLFSKTAKDGLALSGNLDQDNDGIADRVGGYEWAIHREDVITYGEGAYTQTTTALSAQKATRDSANNYAITAADASKKLFTTPTTGATKITFTIWMEGWDTAVGTKTVTKYSYAATDPAPTVGTTVVTDLFEQYKLNGTPIEGNYIQSKGGAEGKAEAGVTYYTRTADNTVKVADWSGENTDGASFQFGLTFDIGRGTFAD